MPDPSHLRDYGPKDGPSVDLDISSPVHQAVEHQMLNGRILVDTPENAGRMHHRLIGKPERNVGFANGYLATI